MDGVCVALLFVGLEGRVGSSRGEGDRRNQVGRGNARSDRTGWELDHPSFADIRLGIN